MTGPSESGRAGNDDGLDAVVQLGREHVVSLGDVLEVRAATYSKREEERRNRLTAERS
jgi:hypothetical protein